MGSKERNGRREIDCPSHCIFIGLRRSDRDAVRHRPLHRVSDDDGGHALQELRNGAAGVQAQGVHRRHGHGQAHQDDARMSQRDQAELHHQVGGGRERQPGESR